MPNPMFNESTFGPDGRLSTGTRPIDDGPVSPWQRDEMTVNGTISATMVLLVLLLISASVGWIATDTVDIEQFGFTIPTLAWVGLGVGFVAVIGLWFRPQLARYVAPVYALAQGFFIGALSKVYESFYDGIVVQAIGATLAVFVVMLVLYRTGIIRVTARFRRIVVGATLGIMLFYGLSFVVMLFGGDISYLRSPSLLGIGFSLFVCAIAAANLALDFDVIERGVQERAPKAFEWFAAFSLLVTIVWLYLEMLRLFAKLRD